MNTNNNNRTFKQNTIRSLKFLGIIAGSLFLLFVVLIIVVGVTHPVPASPTQGRAQSEAPTTVLTPHPTSIPTTVPTVRPTATAVPTAKPVATITPAQLEVVYKLSTTDTTVVAIDKNGASGSGSDQHFTSTIVNFVKDASGNTGGANVSSPDGASIIQVIFTSGTDLSRLNAGDTLEVWGTNAGVFSGSNAFGSTIQEVGIQANYMTDQTTGYQANS